MICLSKIVTDQLMPNQEKLKKLMAMYLISTGIVIASTLTLSPAAEAHHHYRRGELRRIQHDFRLVVAT